MDGKADVYDGKPSVARCTTFNITSACPPFQTSHSSPFAQDWAATPDHIVSGHSLTTDLYNFHLHCQWTNMKLLLTLLAFLQLSHTLHVNVEARNARLKELKRTTQDPTLDDLAGLSAENSISAQKPKKPIPWWKLPNTDNGEMNALTGQQFYPFGDDDDNNNSDDTETTADTTSGKGICPINQCQSSGILAKDYCGPHARCLNGYCQCNFGWKPASNIPMARGWTGLEVLTVRVDMAYQTGCTVRCDSLSCSEVPQVKGCFDEQVKHDKDDSLDAGGHQELATDGLHLGAIKAPGADVGVGFTASAAYSGSTGQAT